MLITQENDITFYQFSNLSAFPEIRHGIFTRGGGYSRPPYHGLNASFGVGDLYEHVEENRRLVSRSMGENKLCSVKQVHGTEILIIDQPQTIDGEHRPIADAVVTNIPGKNLLITVADCQAVLLFDPVQKVIANIHSGWRGSIDKIIGKTIDTMETHFHTSPAHIVAGIGPSLGPCCAEFINYKTEIPHHLWKFKKDRDHFDFWEISLNQLQDAGVSPRNIEISGICTKCRTDIFYSYRKEGVTGRFAAVIGLR